MRYRSASNLSNKKKGGYDRYFGDQLDGKILGELLSVPKFAFIVTIVHNNLVREDNEEGGNNIIWRPSDTTKLRFTNPTEVAKTGGWSQAGLDFFLLTMEVEKQARKEWREESKDTPIDERADYLFYAKPEELVTSDHVHEDGNEEGDDGDEGNWEIDFDESDDE